MSHDNTYRRTTTTTTRNNRRPLYAPPAPGPGHHRHHSFLGYWVPLITIGTIAVGGLAAWIWSERSEHDDDYPPDKPQRPPTGMGAPYPTQGSQPYPGGPYPPSGPAGAMPPPVGAQQQQAPYQPPQGGESSSYYHETQTRTSETRQTEQQEDGTFFGRVSGVMRRAPSPQQVFDHASRQVTAGVAAAGAAAGAALSSIMEEDKHGHAYGEAHAEKEGFSDHERWSEEADELRRANVVESAGGQRSESSRAATTARDGKGKAKRSVAVVVTADIEAHETDDDAYHTEHGSILSHLPAQHDPSQTDLYVLIYAPSLKSLPSIDYQPGKAASTISSFSMISTPALTPRSELQSISPKIDATEPATKHFEVLYNQALSLVSDPSHILPFTTPDGYVHMLRHLAPQLVYISDTLSGKEGESVAQLKGWVGHSILVAGDDGHGGLADTETETEDERSGENTVKWRWYENSPLVGLGKDIEVVDAARVGDDWSRRVFNKE